MQDFRRYSNKYLVPSQFNGDLTCSEVLSDSCDEETLDCLSLGGINGHQINDFSAMVGKNHVTVDEGLSEYAEDLIFDFQNPCISSSFMSDIELENQNDVLRHHHATPLADEAKKSQKEILDEDSSGCWHGNKTLSGCQDNTAEFELDSFRWSFADTYVSPCSASHLQLQTPSNLLTHIILDHSYSKRHGTLPRELGRSMESSLSADDEFDQRVPFSQSNQNEDSERVLSSCADHQVPQLCIEE